MQRSTVRRSAAFAFAASLLGAPAALAHAHLQKSTPADTSTVSTPPHELRLAFTQKVVVALCKVGITKAGEAITTGKPAGEGADAAELSVPLPTTLAPGLYKVTWRVVSVDTHPTSGSFTFTVAP